MSGYIGTPPIYRVSTPSVEELAKKHNVKMAQIAFAWSTKKVAAPIIGTTKLDNLKEMIGKKQMAFVNAEC